MVYAVAPGAEYADWVKVGAHQNTSLDAARSYLYARYGTPFPNVRILHLAFVPVHKMQAEKQLQARLATFHATKEIYRGLGSGLEEALSSAFAAICVSQDLAAAARMSRRKRELLEYQGELAAARAAAAAALVERRMLKAQRNAEVAARVAKRAREEAEDVERQRVSHELQDEERARKKAKLAEEREAKREAKRLAKSPSVVSKSVEEWASRHIVVTDGELLVFRDVWSSFKATTDTKIGRTGFSTRLRELYPHAFVANKRIGEAVCHNVFVGLSLC